MFLSICLYIFSDDEIKMINQFIRKGIEVTMTVKSQMYAIETIDAQLHFPLQSGWRDHINQT